MYIKLLQIKDTPTNKTEKPQANIWSPQKKFLIQKILCILFYVTTENTKIRR